jgi:hypothetical protein
VDLIPALQQAALSPERLYPDDANGHPVARGYHVIAETLGAAVNAALPEPRVGLVGVFQTPQTYQPMLVKSDRVWAFTSEQMIEANGWQPGTIPSLKRRDTASLPLRGVVDAVDPQRFGPAAVH